MHPSAPEMETYFSGTAYCDTVYTLWWEILQNILSTFSQRRLLGFATMLDIVKAVVSTWENVYSSQ